MDYKPKIMQHFVEVYTNNGGPATGYALLMNSFLADKYHFIPLIQKKSLSGINLSLLNDLVKQIKKEKPDIVHIRGLLSEGFYGMLAARLAGCKKVVLSVHGMSIDTIEISPIKKFIYNKFIDPFTLRNADLVYCVCEYATKRPYINKYTNHLYGFIYNVAPEYSKYDSVIAKKKIREELSISADEIVAVSVSRITFEKGYQDLIDAIKRLKIKRLNIRYLIVGEGNFVNEIKRQLSEEIKTRQVILLGKRSDVRDILFASNIFVFPTLHENLSNALLEACAAGLAIIATNVGGNPEVIQNNKSGILIPPKNPQKLANAILLLSHNTVKREQLAAQAQENVRLNFNKDSIFNQIEKMYNSVLMIKKT